MQYVKKLELFLESNKPKSNISLITDICVAMVLINPNFLDEILDRGNRSRYQHNTQVFLNDLKNMVLGKNRLKLGIKAGEEYIEEDNIGKVNSYFNEYSREFDMVNDWNKLNKARDIARNIIDKILPDQKLENTQIRNVYWISPNKETGQNEDIVLELNDGRQFPIVINSKVSLNKTKSFNVILDIMLDQQSDNLYTDEYLERWDKLTQEWFRLVYDNCKNEYKLMIDQFIDATRVDSLTYFDYYDIEVMDPKYKILGKYFPRLEKNYKLLSKLMSDIWKQGKIAINDYTKVEKEWKELKKITLNSKIIEHIIVESLNNLIEGEVKRTQDEYIIATEKVKLRLLRLVADLMNIEDTDVYYFGKSDFYHIPSKQWFRDNYENMNVEYDYHQKVSEEAEDDSQFRIRIELNERKLMELELYTGFSGGEMAGKLNSKIKIHFEPDFNSKIS
jgi:hypothetical protein